ncbi:translation initiation factor IF-3 [Vibrio rarus]|uniref:translation initiation factor IF-3 n=1 Tax=Vibrio rarus TaxID=413403 RepID=UPI0021C435A9|nr:translation initiation factor IF-3 [Vibrio rarus]
MKGGRRGQQQPAKQNQHRLNGEIRSVREVRLTGADGEPVGIVSYQEAQTAADEAGMDLVEISPNAEPPVCRVMDYGKFLFEKSKALKEQKKKQKQIQIKEIKFRPGTDIGDYQVKLRNLTGFLEDGNKVKVTIRFRGREMAHQNIGVDVLNRLKADTEEFAVVESFPSRIEGRQMIMVLAPKKK